MPDHDLEQLLGGFAADTLTPEEQARLYSAALRDQQLFDALADEQALKELLADPAVRRRLLQALNQTGTGDTATWLDWLRRPSGLAWAGGLAAAVFAVVLGTKIYEDSLKQAAQQMATEETRPAAPARHAPTLSQPEPSSVPSLPATTAPQEAPAENIAQNAAPLGRVAKPKPAPASHERRTSDSASSLEKRYREQTTSESKHEMFLSESDTTPRTASPSAAPTPTPDAPAASAPAPSSIQGQSGPAESAAIVPTVSARARFFEEGPPKRSRDARATEQEQSLESMAESMPQPRKQKQSNALSSQRDLATETVGSAKPLGLRHSFMIQGPDGQNHEIRASAAPGQNRPIFLSVEVNQDAYIQVWITGASDTPTLLLPPKDHGATALKLFAGQRPSVLLPTTGQPLTITARISRIPLGPSLEADSAFKTRPGLHMLQETVTAIPGSSHQEEAIYTVNQETSLPHLIVSFPFPAP
ncbi:MAG: hypothetical protein OEY28_03770 [Nitrospira sp.]|nr:hypothetical protein [Nitrospira sp.]